MSLLQAKLWTGPDLPGADLLWTRPTRSLEAPRVAESPYPVSLPFPPKVAREWPPSPRRGLRMRAAWHSTASSPLVLAPASLLADRRAQGPHWGTAPVSAALGARRPLEREAGEQVSVRERVPSIPAGFYPCFPHPPPQRLIGKDILE